MFGYFHVFWFCFIRSLTDKGWKPKTEMREWITLSHICSIWCLKGGRAVAPRQQADSEPRNNRDTYLGTPSLVSSWKRYTIIAPIFGGYFRCLSESPEPTLNFLFPGISHYHDKKKYQVCKKYRYLARFHNTLESTSYSSILPFSRRIPCDTRFGIVK